MALLPRHMIKVARIGRTRMGRVGEVKTSDLGFVEGVWSPNEAGSIMRKWFEGPRQVEQNELVANTFKSLESVFSGPLLSKNLNNSLRLHRIREIFPNARILFIHRERVANGASILAARKRFYGTAEKWLGVEPSGFDDQLRNSEPASQVMWQIKEIESAINLATRDWNSKNFHCTSYEDLCSRPEKTIGDIVAKLGLQYRDEQVKCMDQDSFVPPSGTLEEAVSQKLTHYQRLFWGSAVDPVEEMRSRFRC